MISEKIIECRNCGTSISRGEQQCGTIALEETVFFGTQAETHACFLKRLFLEKLGLWDVALNMEILEDKRGDIRRDVDVLLDVTQNIATFFGNVPKNMTVSRRPRVLV